MSTTEQVTQCEHITISGYYDGDHDVIRCNTCDMPIKGSERFTMAELAQYNERYKRYIRARKNIQEIDSLFSSDYQEPGPGEINAKVDRQRDSQIDNVY